MSIWKKFKLYRAKRKLIEAYNEVQYEAQYKFVLRSRIAHYQKKYEDISAKIKEDFGIDPKSLLPNTRNLK